MTRQAPAITLVSLLLAGPLALSCGKGGTESSTETDTDGIENDYCEQPPYPTDDGGADNSCGCGYSAALHKADNPYYLQCIGEACAFDGDCLPPGEQTSCLWDGDSISSPGSFCSPPCGEGQACPVIEGVQTVCSYLLCIIPCPDEVCPPEMICVDNLSTPAVDARYCIYNFSP